MIKRKKRVRAIELYDCDVEAVSVVDRGAIRSPFKRFKSEDNSEGGKHVGINLTELLGRDKSEPLGLLAIVVSPKTNVDHATTALKAAGFDVDTVQEIDGCHVFVQEDAELDDSKVKLKVSDDLMLILDGEPPKATGLYAGDALPGFAVAGALLSNELAGLAGQPRAIQKADALLKEHAEYVGGLLRKLPHAVLKAEGVNFGQKDKPKDEPEDEKPEEKPAGDKKPAEEKPKEKADDEKVETAKAEAPDLIAQMTTLLETHTAAIDSKLDAKLSEMTQRIEKSEKDTKSALRRVVPGAIEEDDPASRTKNEDPFSGGCFDTAMEALVGDN